jgi:hypothetical protein
VRGVEVIDRIIAGDNRESNLVLLDDLCNLMTEGSLCAMGGLTPMPVRSAVRNFAADFGAESGTSSPTTADNEHRGASSSRDPADFATSPRRPELDTEVTP